MTEMAENDGVSRQTRAYRLRYDVFLSFRGEDTRHDFTERLYNALIEGGVRVFRDNEGLTQGDEIAPGLLDAIEDSAASIAIISPSYASSRWCLEELATICESRRLILPVFYRVDPSDVRRQRGPFGDDFKRLEERFGEEKVGRWRKAMEKVGGISGWVFQNRNEAELIRCLVRRILMVLSNTPMDVSPHTVGLDFTLKELLSSLDVRSNGVYVLGIHGPGGIGKTTIAKALFNKLVTHFESRSFISNVRETSEKENGISTLQNRLIDDLSLGNVRRTVNDVSDGKIAIEQLFKEKRVLMVLDDVDSADQLNALFGKREWLYEGSRIIITTRDRVVLQTTHQVNEIYDVRCLSSTDSLELFSYHALRREKPTKSFLNLAVQIVSLTGGLPLALEVFGSFLLDKRTEKEWEEALQKLQEIRPCNLQDVLMISFNGLDEEEKCVFLDIACLFVNLQLTRDDVIDIMKGCGFRAEIALTSLVTKSLIRIVEDNNLWIHDQVRDMGRQIVQVQHESLLYPGECSRLWNRGDILSVLKHCRGTMRIQGMILDFEKKNFRRDKTANVISWNNLQRTPNFTNAVTFLKQVYKEYFQHGERKEEDMITVWTKSFEAMGNLRLLQFSNVNLEGNFKHIPAGVKWLQWRKCPLKNLPSSFCPRELTVLDLSDSKIERLWGSKWWWGCNKKVAEKLMVMNLHGCYNLTAIPDLSEHRALEKLILERCSRLTVVHKSIGDLSTLHHLNLRDCSNLVKFPSDVSGLKHLENLILSGCSKLKELPQDIGDMKSLRELFVDKTALEKLPDSIFRLRNLETLSLNDCQCLKRLPDCIGRLCSLRELFLNGSALEELPVSIDLLENLETLSLMWCRSLKVIPDSVSKLKSLSKLWLNGSSVNGLPASIGSLSYLMDLAIGKCSSIRFLPSSIGDLASIVKLQLDGTSITDLPNQISGLKSLKTLETRSCKSLRSLPESIGCILSLTVLTMENAAIEELPESIGNLENLIMLRLNKCEKLYRLPESIVKLKSLHHLLMEKTSVTELPDNFGMLSSLMVLKMAKNPYCEVSQNTENSTKMKKLHNLTVLPTSFSNLSSLEEFDARGWKISGKICDDFERLLSLEILNLGHNDFYGLPSSLRGLSILKKLLIPHCKELRVLPLLPSSLVELNAANCTALECISNLSDLESLQELNLTNCEKLLDVPGLECLRSLTRLHMSGCSLCSPMVKGKLHKVALKNLYNLSMPGGEIPDWLNQGVVRFSERKNCVIKALIICVVVSINHQTPDDLRDQLPVIADIHAKILRLEEPVYNTTVYLPGVPKTCDDQVYLCRYPQYHPLVSILRDGDEIRVAMRDPPFVKGVELKKCGVHLVFERDDDYDGDEESLDETQQSVSARLTKFVGSSGEDRRIFLESNNELSTTQPKIVQTIWEVIRIMSLYFILSKNVVLIREAR